jgi:hypothetical protein
MSSDGQMKDEVGVRVLGAIGPILLITFPSEHNLRKDGFLSFFQINIHKKRISVNYTEIYIKYTQGENLSNTQRSRANESLSRKF